MLGGKWVTLDVAGDGEVGGAATVGVQDVWVVVSQCTDRIERCCMA